MHRWKLSVSKLYFNNILFFWNCQIIENFLMKISELGLNGKKNKFFMFF